MKADTEKNSNMASLLSEEIRSITSQSVKEYTYLSHTPWFLHVSFSKTKEVMQQCYAVLACPEEPV